ncbi:MAG: PadR family transcriptional regulator [Rhodoglobus sp.]
MAVEIIMLSVLRAGAVHGYELKRRVQRTTLSALSNNSLYPILRRFEEAGIVTRSDEPQSGKPDRKVYTITDAGRAMLTDLISTLPAKLAANDEEFLVRVSFFHELQPAQRLAILAARSAMLDATLGRVRTLIAESDQAPTRLWRNLTMSRLVDDLERERQWITELETKAAS